MIEKIYNFILTHLGDKGYPPSIRDICNAVGLKSSSSVHSYLKKLVELEVISVTPNITRGIKVLKYNYEFER